MQPEITSDCCFNSFITVAVCVPQVEKITASEQTPKVDESTVLKELFTNDISSPTGIRSVTLHPLLIMWSSPCLVHNTFVWFCCSTSGTFSSVSVNYQVYFQMWRLFRFALGCLLFLNVLFEVFVLIRGGGRVEPTNHRSFYVCRMT